MSERGRDDGFSSQEKIDRLIKDFLRRKQTDRQRDRQETDQQNLIVMVVVVLKESLRTEISTVYILPSYITP